MEVPELLGLVAGALVTLAMIPQIIRVFKLKSAREISMLFTTLLLLGMVCWLAYGIYLSLTPIVTWNIIGIALVTILLYAKLRYGK
ncbi:SemiSWEET family sugar transporter [Chloroflexota bacterium]